MKNKSWAVVLVVVFLGIGISNFWGLVMAALIIAIVWWWIPAKQKKEEERVKREAAEQREWNEICYNLARQGGTYAERGISALQSLINGSEHKEKYTALKFELEKLYTVRRKISSKCAILEDEYGVGKEAFIRQLENTSLEDLKREAIPFKRVFNLDFNEMETAFNVDIEKLQRILWGNALNQDYDANELKALQNVYDFYMGISEERRTNISGRMDVTIEKIRSVDSLCCELCALGRLTHEGKLLQQKRKEVLKWLEHRIMIKDVQACRSLVSCLNWMRVYDLEEVCLEQMAVQGLDLDLELKKRLEYLKDVGQMVPVYTPTQNRFTYDGTAIGWKEQELETFFKSVAYKKGYLDYALAFREWKKSMNSELVSSQFSMEYLIKKLVPMLYSEYGTQIECSREYCERFTGINSELEEGVLIKPVKSKTGFADIGLLLMFSVWGSKLNIRIYTLYIPEKDGADIQRLHAQKVKNGIDTRMVDFEENVKEFLIEKIQSIINEKTTTGISSGKEEYTEF